jgi:hypothetical protein
MMGFLLLCQDFFFCCHHHHHQHQSPQASATRLASVVLDRIFVKSNHLFSTTHS